MLRSIAPRVVVGAMLLAGFASATPATATLPVCTITGTEGDDVFTQDLQTTGDDVVCGLGGNDTFAFSEGNDTYIGGDGVDLVTYIDVPSPSDGCSVSLDADLYRDEAFLVCPTFERDAIPEVENIEGTPWGDHFKDDPSEPNVILGRGGGDQIIFGGAGDEISGNDGPDILRWWWSGRLVEPAAVSGNAGKDLLTPYAAHAGATVDLGGGTVDGLEIHMTFHSIERAQGTFYADTLIGDARNNRLRGLRGPDSLSGGAGDDALVGGEGSDTADGGDGNDVCDAESVSACES